MPDLSTARNGGRVSVAVRHEVFELLDKMDAAGAQPHWESAVLLAATLNRSLPAVRRCVVAWMLCHHGSLDGLRLGDAQ